MALGSCEDFISYKFRLQPVTMATQTSSIVRTIKGKKVKFIHIPLVEFSEISHNCFVYREPRNEYIS